MRDRLNKYVEGQKMLGIKIVANNVGFLGRVRIFL